MALTDAPRAEPGGAGASVTFDTRAILAERRDRNRVFLAAFATAGVWLTVIGIAILAVPTNRLGHLGYSGQIVVGAIFAAGGVVWFALASWIRFARRDIVEVTFSRAGVSALTERGHTRFLAWCEPHLLGNIWRAIRVDFAGNPIPERWVLVLKADRTEIATVLPEEAGAAFVRFAKEGGRSTRIDRRPVVRRGEQRLLEIATLFPLPSRGQ